MKVDIIKGDHIWLGIGWDEDEEAREPCIVGALLGSMHSGRERKRDI